NEDVGHENLRFQISESFRRAFPLRAQAASMAIKRLGHGLKVTFPRFRISNFKFPVSNFRSRSIASYAFTSIGKNTLKQAPCPTPSGGLATRMRPWWSSTIFATMESPRPTPDFFVVKKGLKICSRSSGG